jgi:predicted ferric reductase
VNPPEPGNRYRIFAFLGVMLAGFVLLLYAKLTGSSLSPATWYIARSSGITLYLLLWLSVLFGLGMTTSALDRLGGRAMVFSIHRFVTDLAYAALALHLISLALDHFAPFDFADLLVPFYAMHGDVWIALGVFAAWGMIIVGVSFSLRRWIGQRGWRLLHFAAFPLYIIALFHGIGAGTDTASSWVFAMYIGTLGAVFFLTSYRLLRGKQRGGAPIMPRRQAVPASMTTNDRMVLRGMDAHSAYRR